MLAIQIKGLEPLLELFEKANVELPEQFRRAMVASVVDIKQDAQALVPVRTSQLRTSITEMVETHPLIGHVSVGQPYGKSVEFGSGPRVIVPKKAKALAFYINGELVFARRVNHPGTRPHPYLVPAMRQNLGKIKDYFRRAVESVLTNLNV